MGERNDAKADSERMIADDEKALREKAKKRVEEMRSEADRALMKFIGDAEQRLQADLEATIFAGIGKSAAATKDSKAKSKDEKDGKAESEKSDDSEDSDAEKDKKQASESAKSDDENVADKHSE